MSLPPFYHRLFALGPFADTVQTVFFYGGEAQGWQREADPGPPVRPAHHADLLQPQLAGDVMRYAVMTS